MESILPILLIVIMLRFSRDYSPLVLRPCTSVPLSMHTYNSTLWLNAKNPAISMNKLLHFPRGYSPLGLRDCKSVPLCMRTCNTTLWLNSQHPFMLAGEQYADKRHAEHHHVDGYHTHEHHAADHHAGVHHAMLIECLLESWYGFPRHVAAPGLK